MKERRAILSVLLLISMLSPLASRDYTEPLAVANPLYRNQDQGFQLGAGYFGRIWYEHAGYSSGGDDAFAVGTQGASRLLSWQETAALQLHFASILVVGPVQKEEQAASIAEWWMNAVQYQYGLHAAVRSPYADIIAGYRRTSLHPLRRGYSEIARDQIFIGMSREFQREFLNRHQTNDAAVFLRYTDLWDFWGSALAKPRNLLTLELLLRSELPLNQYAAVFAEIQPRLHWNRDHIRHDIEPSGKIGLRLGSMSDSAIELYLHGYHSRDSEQHAGASYRTTIIGIGLSASGR